MESGKITHNLLSESEIEEVQTYAVQMKRQIISTLKQGRVDEIQSAVENKLREEMVLCAKEFFDKEVKADMLKSFANKKDVLITMGIACVDQLTESIKVGLAKDIADKMKNTYDVRRIVNAIFNL